MKTKEKNDASIRIRISKYLKEAIEKRANDEGKSKSELLRELILEKEKERIGNE